MNLPAVDHAYLLDVLVDLLNTPSPTGMTGRAVDYVEQALLSLEGLQVSRTRKGAVVAFWPGQHSDAPRALTAHVDTLGAMVKEFKKNGRVKLSRLGGYIWNTIEGEGCTIFTEDGREYRGTILLEKASSHVFGQEVKDTERSDATMEVRIDAWTNSEEETRQLGIQVGDFVALDPRVESVNGFVRSRHLDDKACVANILAAVKALQDEGLQPVQDTYLLISNYEEVGHGAAAGIPAQVAELITVDMAAVGKGQESDEFHATLCVKDSGGPYHFELNQKMRRLAQQYQIPYKVDIYPFYGSDGEAFWRAGGDVAVALIGPGVDASHNYERTHMEALIATTQWLAAYLLSE